MQHKLVLIFGHTINHMRVKYINQSHNSSQYMLGFFNNYLVGKKIWPLSFKIKSMWKICMCVLLCLKTMMRMTITNNNPQFDRHVVFSACSWIQRIERTSRKVFILELYLQENMSHTDLWVINCCLTSMEYFISVISLREQVVHFEEIMQMYDF